MALGLSYVLIVRALYHFSSDNIISLSLVANFLVVSPLLMLLGKLKY